MRGEKEYEIAVTLIAAATVLSEPARLDVARKHLTNACLFGHQEALTLLAKQNSEER